MIISPAAALDPGKAVQTELCDGNSIPNERPLFEWKREILEQGAWELERMMAGIVRRRLSAMYNCVGMVFANRRTHIDLSYLQMIFQGDDYRRISRSELREGDVVVYRFQNRRTHVGLILRIERVFAGEPIVFVLSKWGEYREYIHRLDQVPTGFGAPIEFWTDRRLNE